jgi:cellulose synthase (UDP-forming)
MFLSQTNYRVNSFARNAITVLYVMSGLIYLSWRLTVFNVAAPMLSILFYAVEVYGFVMSLIIIMLSYQKKPYATEVAPNGLSVDVFITTYHEPIAMVRRTAMAAQRIRYPHQTYILDDGNRAEMREMAASLGCRYLARTENIGAKAGNLNHGLKNSQADFIALLDADHVPQMDFLDKLLGYFNDKMVSFVQTPQDYFNLDSYQHGDGKSQSLIWHDQSLFHHVGQPARYYWNATTHCGCSMVMRRSSLDEIGGFPTETVTEDMHTSVKLQKLGYKTAYHAEPLAFGVAANDFQEFLRQRLRWGEGNLQVCREEGLPFFCRGLTLPQRICYFALTTPYVDAWQKIVYYLLPAYVLWTQIPPILATPVPYASYFIPYVILTFLFFEEMGRGYGRIFSTEKYSMARLGVSIIATLGLVRKHIKFKVSSKSLKREFKLSLLLPQITIVIANMSAVIYTLLRPYIDQPLYMPMGITVSIAIWAIVISLLAMSVIVDAARVANKREEDYMFTVPLGVELADCHGVKVIGLVKTISLQELRLEVTAKNNIPAMIQGDIYLPSSRLPFNATVTQSNLEGGKYHITAKFNWDNVSVRDDLEHLLHAGRWGRLANNQHEYVQTPLQRITNLITSKDATSPIFENWQPILYREVQRATQDWCYGLVNIQNNKIKQLMCFSIDRLSPLSPLTILELTNHEQHVLLVQDTGALQDEMFGLKARVIYKTVSI